MVIIEGTSLTARAAGPSRIRPGALRMFERPFMGVVACGVAVGLLASCTSSPLPDGTLSTSGRSTASPPLAGSAASEAALPESHESGAEPPAPKESSPSAAMTSPSPATDARVPVEPVISYVGPGTAPSTVVVNAFVPRVVETGGTCTVALTAGGETRSSSAPAFADATTTVCDAITVSTDGLPVGSARVVLKYGSGDSAGSSAAFQVEIGSP